MKTRRKRSAFLGHLEDISWRAFEDYPKALREVIKGKSGLYALYHNGTLYYVGLASNLMGRLKTHLRDRHHGKWDRFSVYLTAEGSHLKELEALVLRIIRHSGNAVSGKLSGSKNMHSDLNRTTKELDATRRAFIMGGPVAERHRKNAAKRFKSSKALNGIAQKGMQIVGFHKGKKYHAVIRKDGIIRYLGQEFTSPSGAARAIVKGSVNGWAFWKYKNDQGEMIRLSHARH